MQSIPKSKYTYLNYRRMKEDIRIFDIEDDKAIILNKGTGYFFMSSILYHSKYLYEIWLNHVSREDYENAFKNSKEVEYLA